MFSLVLASVLLGSGDFAADIRNAEDFIQLKAEVTHLKAEVAELKARCKCVAASNALTVAGNELTFFVDPPSNCATCQQYAATYKSTPTKAVTRTTCVGGNCSSVDPSSRMIVHSTPVQVSSYGVVSGGCSAGSCSQAFEVPAQTFRVAQQSLGVRHFKQRTKCKGCK